MATVKKQRRGFAAMSEETQKRIASLGGKAAHAQGTAHEFTPEEARLAGKKGGQAAQRARKARDVEEAPCVPVDSSSSSPSS
jgi:uncharacterized protein